MDADIFGELNVLSGKNTPNNDFKSKLKSKSSTLNKKENKHHLSTKLAVKLLLEGTLKSKVCRYCLNVTTGLSELDQIMNIGGSGNIYKVTIRDIVASFHPFKVTDDPNFPNKICQKCVDRALGAYLFTQQCEQAERAMLNCFDDIYEKFIKLDPIERQKKRGRQKLNPNFNILHAEHYRVIDYAEPIINIVNLGAETVTKEPNLTDLECKKCWQVLPNLESLMNHEKIHPKTMWYHCRICGKSFPKSNQLKSHHKKVHIVSKALSPKVETVFKCIECGLTTDNYIQHLQHIEKHKLKNIMQHLVEKKMDMLCAVCFNKGTNMSDLDEMVSVHGGHPALMGDKSLTTLLTTTLPDMTQILNFIGTKICDKCLNNAITSYIFIHQHNFARQRLKTCVTEMLNNIKNIVPNVNVFVEISLETIMPATEANDETLLLDENDYIDETKLKVHVLEDEFRVKSDSDSEESIKGEIPYVNTSNKTYNTYKSAVKTSNKTKNTKIKEPVITTDVVDMDFSNNPAKNATKAYKNKKLMNGLHSKYSMDVCSEFLTFNDRSIKKVCCKFTCPLCYKHFISDYFLKRHIIKHINKTVQCAMCNIVFISKFYLYEHKKMYHMMERDYYMSCKICGRSFLNKNKLKIHENNHRTTKCDLCCKVFSTQNQFNNHVQRHGVQLKYINQKSSKTCSFCEKECPNNNELSLHVNKVHLQIKPYGCDMCERQFYTEKNLKYHKKVHSRRSKETCEFCMKTFKCRKQLVTHVRKHIGVKPFHCQVCDQSFYSTYKVMEHMKVYHGGRFCCRVCKTTFVTKYGLKDHVLNEHGLFL